MDWQIEWKDAGAEKGKTPEDWYPVAQSDFESLTAAEESIAFITYIETSHECSGICQKSQFYVSERVSKGIPESACLDKV